MFLSRSHLHVLVIIVALSLCARADSIPAYPDGGAKQSLQIRRPYPARMSSIELLYDSAIIGQTRSDQPAARVFFNYEYRADSVGAMRGRNVLEWLFRMIAKIVLPSHGRGRTRK